MCAVPKEVIIKSFQERKGGGDNIPMENRESNRWRSSCYEGERTVVLAAVGSACTPMRPEQEKGKREFLAYSKPGKGTRGRLKKKIRNTPLESS